MVVSRRWQAFSPAGGPGNAMIRWLVLVTLLSVLALLPVSAGRAAPLAFTQGVAAGDVRPFSAVLWTRVDGEAVLVAEVSADPSFAAGVLKRVAVATADNDFTARAAVAPLTPDTAYFYRWRHGSAQSEVGTFKTPPLPSRTADVRFVYAGDSDGSGDPPLNNFEVLDRAREEGPDFLVYLGDTVYMDTHPPFGTDLPSMRDKYKENRGFPALRDMLAATSTYAIWDDHEVTNDYAGQTVDPALYAAGREAFREYMPLGNVPLHDPTCAGDPLFRTFGWARDVDVIVLDERSCRSGSVETACQMDLAPALPPAIRTSLGLPPSPPPGCLEALNDPARTMLGPVQKQALKAALLSSRARFKFIINEVPVMELFALPYDRWEGYAAERAEILRFIRDQDIENAVFLTTDFHVTLFDEVDLSLFVDPRPIAREFVTGPIAAGNLRGFPPGVVALAQAILGLIGVDCSDLTSFSYGLVEVDAAAGTASVKSKDDLGNTLCAATVGGP
ncbi:MAG TPA: alkaline phosphatase D family protein [Dehalococcoidia bacterium]|nr:alkaline phosphatase D family protein [Dehalococcoidia bacterium]